MTAAGYGAEDAARVGSLVRKERLKRDAETQLLEDVVCVVFLEHYIDGFMAKTDEDKLADILAKTWVKMSALGHEHALKLPLAPDIPRLLERGLARQSAAE
jgi:predicted phosphohydrolase